MTTTGPTCGVCGHERGTQAACPECLSWCGRCGYWLLECVCEPEPRGFVRDDALWGRWGLEPPCEHLIALRNFLADQGIAIWAERSVGDQCDAEDGWVNVNCPHCHRTYEVNLTAPGGRQPMTRKEPTAMSYQIKYTDKNGQARIHEYRGDEHGARGWAEKLSKDNGGRRAECTEIAGILEPNPGTVRHVITVGDDSNPKRH